MDIEKTTRELGEQKVVRRGVLAAALALGAGALTKLVSPQRAQASDGQGLVIGNTNVIGVGEQTATSATVLNTLTGGGAGFVVSGGSGATAASTAIHAVTQHVSGYGVVGRNDQNAAFGVAGVNFGTGAGVGVEGQALGGTVLGVRGVHGNGGTGVKGVSNASGSLIADGTGGGIGVHGKSGNGKGVLGQSSSGDGAHGHSTSGVGLRGTSANSVGLVGISDNSIGLYGYNAAVNTPAFYAENLAPTGRIAGKFFGDVVVQGNFSVTGVKAAAVTMPDGSEATMYSQESPEPYFEDFGRGQLTDGAGRVLLEPEFASLVRRDGYMVFTQPEADCKGLYVTSRDAQGFEVKELQGGKSSLPFTYRVVGRRKDIEGKRLARFDPAVKQNIARMRAESARKIPTTAMVGRTEAPLVPHEPIVPVDVQTPDIDRRR